MSKSDPYGNRSKSPLPVTNDPGTAPAAAPPGERPPQPKNKRRNFAQSKPLPLDVHPLPAFHPSNPISLLRLAYTWISHVLLRPSSHPHYPYIGDFSSETRSVHVTDPEHARALWEMGFFGKGNLSRSEPSWLQREKARLRRDRAGRRGGRAAEDATNVRREERRLFKLERARAEREMIERQKLIEQGQLHPNEWDQQHDDESEQSTHDATSDPSTSSTKTANGMLERRSSDELKEINLRDGENQLEVPSQPALEDSSPQDDYYEPDIDDQEHLQLTLEEAFFLCYGLGVLSILPPEPSPFFPYATREPYSTIELFEMFSQHSFFPPSSTPSVDPDDPFLLNYVAYHHFRSLGWVVRPGVKFAADYLLYSRGPVFSHAEFAVLIIPSYSDRYWNTPGGRSRRRLWEQKDWWWLHCINRVQSQVKKTLVLCYVDVPSPFDVDFDEPFDIGKVLRSYKVRDFVIRRWLANRSRD